MASASDKGKQIGGRIAQARLEAGGMTQDELAHLLGLTARSVQAHEAGDVIPYRYLREYEKALGKPAAWFLHGEAALVGSTQEHQELLERLDRLQQAVDALSKKLG